MVQALAGFPPFEVALAGVSGADGEYLRYDIKQGNDALIALHDRLYSGPLASYLDITRSYQPHLTLGRIAEATPGAGCSTSSPPPRRAQRCRCAGFSRTGGIRTAGGGSTTR
jgi:2'-5' RNA ligase